MMETLEGYGVSLSDFERHVDNSMKVVFEDTKREMRTLSPEEQEKVTKDLRTILRGTALAGKIPIFSTSSL